MDNLIRYKLGDISDFNYGKMPKKNMLNIGKYPTYSGYKYQYSYPESNCNKGDLIVVARGVGGTGDVKLVKEECYLTNLSIKISLNKDIILNEYFYYKYQKNNLRYLDSGSAQSQITISDLEKIELEVPILEEQEKIASILKSLDDKIELNNKMNETLEEMAQTMFKEWFVNFNFPNEEEKPYKDNGGKMIESELGMIPEGWRVEKLENSCFEITRGMTPKYQEFSSILVMNQKVNKGKFLEKQYFKYLKEGMKISDNKKAKKYDIFLNSLGQGTLGRIHYYLEETENIVVDQHMTIIRLTNEKIPQSYFYLLLSSEKYKNKLESLVSGTTGMLMLNISKVRNLETIIPDDKILKFFEDNTFNLFELKQKNIEKNEVLIKTRDTLLPKLMSGEIRIK